MITRRIRSLVLLILLSIVSIPCPADAAPIAPAAIQQAIDKGKQYLYSKQNADGSWENSPKRVGDNHHWGELQGDTWGGTSVMAVYALLSAGEDASDPRVAKGIDFVRNSDQIGIYNLSMRCVVWSMLPQTKENRDSMSKDVAAVLKSMKTKAPARGFHHYLSDPNGTDYDLSVSQFAVLGLWAAANSGLVAEKYWDEADKAWRAEQFPEGSWAYNKHYKDQGAVPRITMTMAGIATLFITNDFVRPGSGACNGNQFDSNIEKGMSVLTSQFDKAFTVTTPSQPNQYYSMYGLERIGVASGYKYFGDVDWFARVSAELLKMQAPDGRWTTGHGHYDVINTSFAIVTLSRGRAPVVMNKLRYGDLTDPRAKKGANWNQRPRDVANAVRWISKQVERDLNWQIVTLQGPVTDLHDAPLLYIAGDQPPTFSDEDIEKLRTYVFEGGRILANADCANAGFAKAMRDLGTKMFPMYEWRELPNDHPIYTRQQFSRANWKNKPAVYGLSNGVRELMLLVPTADLSRAWQTHSEKIKEELYQLVSNFVLYSVDRTNLQAKGQTHIVFVDSNIKPDRTIKVARLKYPGNWDPEPAGWKRLSNLLVNARKTVLSMEMVELKDSTKIDAPIAHLTGTTPLSLTSGQRQSLKQFVESGGTLIVDAAGGAGEFAVSAEKELSATFDGKTFEKLSAEHPVYANVIVKYRAFAKNMIGASDAGRLKALTINDRAAVIFSAEDLSAGLVGQAVDGIIGYEPDTAAALVSNLLMSIKVEPK